VATEKLLIALDSEIAEEVRRRAGARGLSRFVNAAVRQYLQALRLREYEEELAARHGPVPDEVKKRAAAVEWPS
jgi:hypothetical protein